MTSSRRSPAGDRLPIEPFPGLGLTLLVITLAVVMIVTAILVLGSARAEGVSESCSAARVSQAGATRSWSIEVSGTGNSAILAGTTRRCNAAGSATLSEFGSGSSLTLLCQEATSGAVPPAVADAITVRGYIDNNDFNNPGAAGIWVWNVGTSCAGSPTQTFHCTNDGTVGGSARYGLVRLMIRATDAAVPAYDVNSDDGGATSDGEWGVYRCNPGVDAFTDGNPTTSPTLYVGSDTYRSSITFDAAAYRSVTNVRFSLVCSPFTNTVTPDLIGGTSAVTADIRMKGSPTATWQDDCTIAQRAARARNSAITDLGAVGDYNFDASDLPADVTLVSPSLIERTTKVLDRTIQAQASGCDINVDPNRINRGESVTATCGNVRNARGENLASGRLGRQFTRELAGFGDTTDFASVDFTYGAAGLLSVTITARTTATNTNATPTLDYAFDFQVWESSRTDAEFEGQGSLFNILDVSRFYNLHTILLSKTPGGSVNSSIFVIGSDLQFITPKRLMGARGQVIVGANVDCERTNPNSDLEAAVDHGNSAAGTGDAEEREYAVVTPSGTWTVTCNTTTPTNNGNALGYVVEFMFISPLDADLDIRFFKRWWNISDVYHLNVTIQIVRWDFDTQEVLIVEPDDTNVTLVVSVVEHVADPPTAAISSPINLVRMQRLNGFDGTFWANVTLPALDIWSVNALVKANVSGLNVLRSEGITVPQPGSEDVTLPNEIAVPLALLILSAVGFYLAYAVVNPIAAWAGAFIQLACSMLAWGAAATYLTDPLQGILPAIMMINFCLIAIRAFIGLKGANTNAET